MGGWGGGIGIKAKLRPAGAGAWPELGQIVGQNGISNTRYIADIEFLVGGGWWWFSKSFLR